MKVLHINEHLQWAGGVETYLLSIIPRLESLGYEQAVVYARGQAGLVERSHHVPELSRADRKSGRAGYAALQSVLARERPDLVHLHQVHNTGAIAACLERVPVVVHAHDYRYVCPSSGFYYKRAREVCRRTAGPGCFTTTLSKHCLSPRPGYALDYYRRVKWVAGQANRIAAVVAPSEAARQRYLAAGFDPARIEVHPYFCTLPPGDAPRPLPERPTALFIGRIRPNKGVDTFVEAFARLPADTRAIMVGDFSDAARASVGAQAGRLGCADRLQMRPWVARAEIREVFEQATVFVFPSLWPETLGIVGIEALACGVPVVASDIGGVREWLKEGETGYLAEPKNAAKFAARIGELLKNEVLNLEMGRNGQRLIRERFTPGYHIERLLGLYHRVVLEHGDATAEAAH